MDMDSLTALAKKRGLFWPAAEIYGGISGIYDYGHIGALIKRKFENLWISYFTMPDNYYFLDCSTILPEKPLVASGHAALFNDILVGCKKCGTYYRADVLLNELGIKVSEGANADELNKVIKEKNIRCPKCKGTFEDAKAFNMMFDISLGPEKLEKGYLRPETAQSIYLNFYREFNILRKKLPLGLATIGKAYRNEISPRQGLYRMRELTQAELQIFFDPESWKPKLNLFKDRLVNVVMYFRGEQERLSIEKLIEVYNIPEFYAYHIALVDFFYEDILGVPSDKLRFFEKGGDSKAFYNKIHMDIEADVESWGGFKEIGGIHYRGDYDLSSHMKGSKQDLTVDSNNKKIIPNVLELSFGVDRNMWMLVDIFFKKLENRDVLQIKPYIAPYIAAVLPLQNDENLEKKAEHIYKALRKTLNIDIDTSGSIGRRYARMDEIGIPFCITVDYDTINKESENYETVTVRFRDDKNQIRIKINELDSFLHRQQETEISIPNE
ncbi:MAG: glycine--tRNA ligase [Candidatus Micrarchaeia archaeon]